MLDTVEAKRQPSHDQVAFKVKDLAVLWYPIPRSTIYRMIAALPDSELIIPPGYSHPKIDTTKHYRRKYRTFYISRKLKEKLEKQMGLPVGGET